MAWKSKITAVEQNVEKVTITYDILNDSGVIQASGQQIVVSNPVEATLSSIKADLMEVAKGMSLASERTTELSAFINAEIEVD